MKIQILSTSDVHGFIFPTNFSTRNDYHPWGYLKAAQVIKEQRAAADVTFYIENGDFLEGSPMAAFAYQTMQHHTYFKEFGELLNKFQVDCGVLGNHEFNYGEDYLTKVLADRNYPILGANLDKEGNQILDAPYQIITKKGVSVAFLGLTTQYIPHWEQPKNIKGWHFEAAVTAAKKWVPFLQTQADLVVVAYHGGIECDPVTGAATEPQTGENEGYRLLAEVPGIDALVTGHQHRQLATHILGVPVTQPGYRGECVGCITLDLDEGGRIAHSQAQLLSTATAALDAETTTALRSWYYATQDWLDQPLAKIEGNMRLKDHLQARLAGHPYLEFVNQVQMEATGTKIAATALFSDEVQGFNNLVTIRDVINSYIFPNTLVVEEVSGEELTQALERCAAFFELRNDGSVGIAANFLEPKQQLFNYDYYSGIDYTFDLTQPVGKRVKNLVFHGKKVNKETRLKVTLNQYRGVGGGDYPMFAANKIIASDEHEVAQLLIAYLQRHPKYIAVTPHNLHVITK